MARSGGVLITVSRPMIHLQKKLAQIMYELADARDQALATCGKDEDAKETANQINQIVITANSAMNSISQLLHKKLSDPENNDPFIKDCADMSRQLVDGESDDDDNEPASSPLDALIRSAARGG
jgi:hypothetical protein